MPHPLFRKKSITAILADAESGLSDATHSASGLKKVLKVRDLTAMGIAAVGRLRRPAGESRRLAVVAGGGRRGGRVDELEHGRASLAGLLEL